MKDYESGHDAEKQLKNYFLFYNEKRPHQAHHSKTPQEVYFQTPKLEFWKS